MIAKQPLQRLQPGSRAGGDVPAEIRRKLNELYMRCKCHERGTKRSRVWKGNARTEVYREDQGA